jgi:hypothetical protein
VARRRLRLRPLGDRRPSPTGAAATAEIALAQITHDFCVLEELLFPSDRRGTFSSSSAGSMGAFLVCPPPPLTRPCERSLLSGRGCMLGRHRGIA